MSIRYDNPMTRQPHGFPQDPMNKEIIDMMERGVGIPGDALLTGTGHALEGTQENTMPSPTSPNPHAPDMPTQPAAEADDMSASGVQNESTGGYAVAHDADPMPPHIRRPDGKTGLGADTLVAMGQALLPSPLAPAAPAPADDQHRAGPDPRRSRWARPACTSALSAWAAPIWARRVRWKRPSPSPTRP